MNNTAEVEFIAAHGATLRAEDEQLAAEARNAPPHPADRPETYSQFQDYPWNTCLRCGHALPKPNYLRHDDGGRRRKHCSDACRRAASRARERHGDRWWTHQPWYPRWAEAVAAWRQRKAEERVRVAAMPPHVKAGYQQARERHWWQQKEVELLAIELLTFTMRWEQKHRKRLSDFGAEVRIISPTDRKVSKLLRQAVTAAGEAEALALFAKARQLAAAEEHPADDPDLEGMAFGGIGSIFRPGGAR